MQDRGFPARDTAFNTVLLNGREVWEQGSQEGVLVPFLLAEAVAEIPAEAVAISPPEAAHGNPSQGLPWDPGGILWAAGGTQGTQTHPLSSAPLSWHHPQGVSPLSALQCVRGSQV